MIISKPLGVCACAAWLLALACSDDAGSFQTPAGGGTSAAGHSGSASAGTSAGTFASAGSLAGAGRAGSSATGGTFGVGGTSSGGSVSFGGTFVTGGSASGGTSAGGGNSGGGSQSTGGDLATGGNSNGVGCPATAPMTAATCSAAAECEFPSSYCECQIEDGQAAGLWQCEPAGNPGSAGANAGP